MLRNREITKIQELIMIIDETQVCCVAMCRSDQPYLVPMNFARDESYVYLHCDNKGEKLDILAENPRVCINFNSGNELFYRHEEVACSWGMKYKSVNLNGVIETVSDYSDKYRIMKLFMVKYAGRDFEFSEPAIRNVKVLRVALGGLTGKKYGYQ